MFRLPVSGRQVWLLAPDGHDELFLAEAPDAGFTLRVDVVRRLAPPVDDGVTWDALPAADVDAALLALRRWLYGDRVVAEVRCGACHAKGDVTLVVSEYLASHAPERVRGVVAGNDGWLQFGEVRFRVPAVGDLLDVLSQSDDERVAARMLEARCVGGARDSVSGRGDVAGGDASSDAVDGPGDTGDHGAGVSVRARRRAMRVIERVAPALSGDIEGACPECGEVIRARFEPGEFVVAELRQPALAVFEDVHVLASGYGWSEATILDLPVARRRRYAELILAGRYAAPEPSVTLAHA